MYSDLASADAAARSRLAVVVFAFTTVFFVEDFFAVAIKDSFYLVTEIVLFSAAGAFTIKRPFASLAILYPVPFAAQTVPVPH